MFKTSGSLRSHQHSPLESSIFKSCMIAPVEIRQHEFLPVSANPCRVSANLGFNEYGISGWPGRGLTVEGNDLIGNSLPHSQIPLHRPYGSPDEKVSLVPSRVAEKPWTYEALCPQQRKFLVFDQSGSETRLVLSPLCPQFENLPTSQTTYAAWNSQVTSAKPIGTYNLTEAHLRPAKPFDAYDLAEAQARKVEQAVPKAPVLYEESGENEIFFEGSEMHEDTEEINALLYSDGDDDDDCGNDSCGDYEDDEVSSGHSPLIREVVCQKHEEQELDSDDEVASSNKCSKKRKFLDGGHDQLALMDTITTGRGSSVSEKGGDLICALDEAQGPTVGSKRLRKDNIRNTLKVLEGIIPGVKSKDPLVILDEAINYLKCLKCNAETAFEDDSYSSGCYEQTT